MTVQPISDNVVIDLLRDHREMTVSALAAELNVTATAVRQRLNRLMSHQLVQRKAAVEGRGRPSHRYSLTSKGRRQVGSNFGDLAVALWDELRAIKDLEVRRGLLQRIAGRLANSYDGHVHGKSVVKKMKTVAALFDERNVPFSVDTTAELPVLTAHACPYPELAEQDRSVCAMERLMISELLGEKLQLTECRLDGSPCCTFELT